MKKFFRNTPARAFNICLIVMALSACGGANVKVPGVFPIPIIEELPIKVGLYIEPTLRKFNYSEKIKGYGQWSIELGPSQEDMFLALTEGMFSQSKILSGLTEKETNSLDAILIPTIVEIQFSIPKQTRTDFFEVWIKYRITLQKPSGEVIGEWDLPSYGTANKKNYGNLQGNNPALQKAALNACRDAMAFFITQFHTVPGIKSWLLSEK